MSATVQGRAGPGRVVTNRVHDPGHGARPRGRPGAQVGAARQQEPCGHRAGQLLGDNGRAGEQRRATKVAGETVDQPPPVLTSSPVEIELVGQDTGDPDGVAAQHAFRLEVEPGAVELDPQHGARRVPVRDPARAVGPEDRRLAGDGGHRSATGLADEVTGQRDVDLVRPGIVAVDGDVGAPADVAEENRAEIECLQGEARPAPRADGRQLVREVHVSDALRHLVPVPRWRTPVCGHALDRIRHRSRSNSSRDRYRNRAIGVVSPRRPRLPSRRPEPTQ